MNDEQAEKVLSVLTSQRAHREFSSEPVPDEDIAKILTAATHAPSAENSQPWEFIVVTDDKLRAALGELMRRAWDGGGRDASRDALTADVFADVDRGLTGGIASAPVMILCCADLNRTRKETVGSSLFPAVQNLLVAATALGYGSALTTIATVFTHELRNLPGFPESVVPVALVPLGRPARKLGPPRRDPAGERTHQNGW
jgi:nitroreductase